MQLGGIHHITAVTSNPSLNVAFYTQVLGLRFTKKTVNQDDVSAYHLFYGDDLGRPGTDLTFFDWANLPPHRPGLGTISTISFGVTGLEALTWWEKRFDSFHIAHNGIQTRGENGPSVLAFRDPEGQRLELIDDGGKIVHHHWKKSPVPADLSIRGFASVHLSLRKLEPTELLLTRLLGFRQSGTYQTPEGIQTTVFEVGPGGPGSEVHVEVRTDWPFHRYIGSGGVHHVAFRVPNDEEQLRWREQIASALSSVTPVIDRFYFRSVYFREPGGVLFELATDGPGFTVDEDAETLGERLSLPPFLEARRGEIEAQLKPIAPLELASSL